MRILIVSNLFPPMAIGGYEIACRDTFELLSKNHECFVVTSLLGDFKSKEEEKIFRVLELSHSFGIRSKDADIKHTEKHNRSVFNELLLKIRPDIVYFWNINGAGFSIVDCVEEQNIPYCFHLMDESLLSFSFEWIKFLKDKMKGRERDLKRLNRYVKNPIFISRYIEKCFAHHFSGKSSIVYPFLNLEQFRPKTEYKIKDSIRGVYLGQIEKHKGVVELCQSVSHYNQKTAGPKIKLTLFGRSLSGLDKELLENFKGNIEIIAGVPREELLVRLSDFDVGFFPSVWEEPFGIAQIELLAAGLPVLSSRKGGSCELLSDNEVIATDFSPAHFFGALSDLIEHYEERAPRMAKSARDALVLNHTPQVYSDLIEKHFKSILT